MSLAVPALARAARCLVRKPFSSSRVSLAARCAFTTDQVSSTSTTAPPEGILSSDFQQSRAAYHQSEEEALQYVSPYQELFDAMHANLSTATNGLTEEEELELERNQPPVKRMQCGIPEHVLRFSTASYSRTLAPPHVMPNEHRVVAKIHTKYLPLTDVEMEILQEIVGKRLNLQRNEFRLTSNQFGSRIENKRHLVSMMDRIILSCQRLGRELQEEAKEAQAADKETA